MPIHLPQLIKTQSSLPFVEYSLQLKKSIVPIRHAIWKQIGVSYEIQYMLYWFQ